MVQDCSNMTKVFQLITDAVEINIDIPTVCLNPLPNIIALMLGITINADINRFLPISLM